MKNVIIGAGPSGLYTAISLKQAGAKDIVIYDPRAGSYTRPGHLNSEVFKKAEQGIGKKFWPDEKGHIKDLERKLYIEAQKLGIPIEKKRFITLRQDKIAPGVIIADEAGIEEFIPSKYVFDCTGSQRQVIHAVNHIAPDSPLKLNKVTDISLPHHFIAYVKMNEAHLKTLTIFSETEERLSYSNAISAIKTPDFAQSIMQLRELGWREFKFPRCYGVPFGKGKVCLYLQTPADLLAENYDRWVQTVLECYIKPVSYQHLPPSKKYASKPRFTSFTVSANALQKVSYQGHHLPTVIALGDAQIDPDYYLAHGILNGIVRINALLNSIEIFKGDIEYFNSDDYQQAIEALLRGHQTQVIHQETQLKQAFLNALEPTKLKLQKALAMTQEPHQQQNLYAILHELNAHLSYEKARQLFSETHTMTGQTLKLSTLATTDIITKLEDIHTNLNIAWSDLPSSLKSQRKKTLDLLCYLATSWKEIGSAFFKEKKLASAIQAYNKALEIYDLPGLTNQFIDKELPLHSNLIIIYNAEKRYPQAIAAAQAALKVYERCPAECQPVAIHEKIIFNLIKALCAEGQELHKAGRVEAIHACHTQAMELFSTHADVLVTNSQQQAAAMIEALKQQLPQQPAKELSKNTSTTISAPLLLQPHHAALQQFGTFAATYKKDTIAPLGSLDINSAAI